MVSWWIGRAGLDEAAAAVSSKPPYRDPSRGGIVGISTGCSSMTPNNKTQTMGVYALGIPGIAVITQSTQAADATGEDVNANRQTNPVTTELKAK